MLLEIFSSGLDYISGWQLTLTCITMFSIGLVILLAEPLRKFISKHILVCMYVIFLLGFILYVIGFYEGASKNPLTLTFRAIISSIEMFTSHSDLIEVSHALKEHSVTYMVAFSLIHFLAVIVSAILILDIFGKRLISREYAAIMGKSHYIRRRDFYVFDGVDDNSISLARSIYENNVSSKPLIVFVRSSLPTDMKRFSLVDIFLNPSARKEEEIGIPGAKLVYSNLPLSVVVRNHEGKLFKSLIKMLTRAKTASIFFLSSDSSANSAAAFALKSTLDAMDRKIKIYANVDFKSTYTYNLAKQSASGTKTEIRFINAARLAAEYLRSKPALQPVNFANQGRFSALVLGFSTTGQEVFNALYEVGSEFDFKCQILDKQMHSLKGEYLSLQEEIAKNPNVELKNMDYYSTDFWDLFPKILDDLNFVVMCLGDEEENVKIAFKLYEYALQHRKNKTENFRIFVKTKKTEDARMAAVLRVRYGHLEADNTIVPFGSSNQVFNYDLLSLALASVVVFC